jgi:CHAT domain
LEQPEPVTPLEISTPLRILVMIANPPGTQTLDVDAEWDKLRPATAAAVEAGYVELEQVKEPTLGSLTDHLRDRDCHVFHFIGHGGFIEGQNVGALVMQDDEGRPRLVTGEALGSLLWGYERDPDPPRLVVLNACEGAKTGSADPFAGVAESLMQQGMPVVVAMATRISDRASISFAEGFYRPLAFGTPVEFALGQARWAIFTDANEEEWAVPVLYTRLPEARPFDVEHLTEEQRKKAEQEAILRAFWHPTGATRIAVVMGKWPKALTDRGEREDVVPLSFAMILGELRSFLSDMYQEVEMTDDPAAADGGTPVVALGGPLANELTARLAERYSPPVWFRGLPYEANSQRSIGTDEDAFMPRIDESGSLVSDVGLAVRIIEPDGRPAFIVGGCYGAGTLGAARHLYEAENLTALQSEGHAKVVAVTRSQVSGWDVSGTELIHVRSW